MVYLANGTFRGYVNQLSPPHIYSTTPVPRPHLLNMHDKWPHMTLTCYPHSQIYLVIVMSFSVLQVVSMSGMFRSATSYVGLGIAMWNTGSLSDVMRMFDGASVFDEDISPWNTAGELQTDSNVVKVNRTCGRGSCARQCLPARRGSGHWGRGKMC